MSKVEIKAKMFDLLVEIEKEQVEIQNKVAPHQKRIKEIQAEMEKLREELLEPEQ